MIISVKCEKCGKIYDWDAGKITFNEEGTVIFEFITICPKCGAKDRDLLTESAQTQISQLWFET